MIAHLLAPLVRLPPGRAAVQAPGQRQAERHACTCRARCPTGVPDTTVAASAGAQQGMCWAIHSFQSACQSGRWHNVMAADADARVQM